MEKKFRFKEGSEVAHKDNLSNKMIVTRIIKKSYRYKDFFKTPPEEKTGIKILGIACHWWDTSNQIQRFRFHTQELVPWDIAQKGQGSVDKWLKDKFIHNQKITNDD